MRIYLYDLVNHTRLLEFRLFSFINDIVTADLTDNYIAEEGDDPRDLGFLGNYEIGIDFSDGTNEGKCHLIKYSRDTGRALFEIKSDELANRRKYLRVPVREEFELVITKPQTRHITVIGLDISYGGFGFKTSKNLEYKQSITLEIPTATTILHIDGKIVRKKKSGIVYEYGVMFQDIELNGSLGDAIYSFITSKSRLAV